MKRLFLLGITIPLLCPAQVYEPSSPSNDAVFSQLKQIIVSAQAEIRPALGENANQCFTDADYKKFQDDKRASAIAKDISESNEFGAAVRALRGLNQQSRLKILSGLRGVRQRTVAENGGRFGPDSQTDAGAKAQKDIAIEIAAAVERHLR